MLKHGKNGINFGSSISKVNEESFQHIKGISFGFVGEIRAIKFEKVDLIDEHAFDWCSSLEQIWLGSSQNITIKKAAFSNCENLREVGVDKNARFSNIETLAFSHCYLLRKRENFKITNENLKNIGF
jgi:hypothetical protein